MSLKTSPPVQPRSTEQFSGPLENVNATVTFIHPDGQSADMRLFEGLILMSVYARRGASSALYTPDRRLVIECFDNKLRGSEVLFSIVNNLVSAFDAEVTSALRVEQARQAALRLDESEAPEVRTRPQTARPSAEGSAHGDEVTPAQAENSDLGNAQGHADTRGGRFRRGRR